MRSCRIFSGKQRKGSRGRGAFGTWRSRSSCFVWTLFPATFTPTEAVPLMLRNDHTHHAARYAP